MRGRQALVVPLVAVLLVAGLLFVGLGASATVAVPEATTPGTVLALPPEADGPTAETWTETAAPRSPVEIDSGYYQFENTIYYFNGRQFFLIGEARRGLPAPPSNPKPGLYVAGQKVYRFNGTRYSLVGELEPHGPVRPATNNPKPGFIVTPTGTIYYYDGTRFILVGNP